MATAMNSGELPPEFVKCQTNCSEFALFGDVVQLEKVTA